MSHRDLLGIEFPVVRDERYYQLVDLLESRGLLGYVKYTNPVAGIRRYLVLTFPEKGRNRFLRRHLEFLEILHDEYGSHNYA